MPCDSKMATGYFITFLTPFHALQTKFGKNAKKGSSWGLFSNMQIIFCGYHQPDFWHERFIYRFPLCWKNSRILPLCCFHRKLDILKIIKTAKCNGRFRSSNSRFSKITGLINSVKSSLDTFQLAYFEDFLIFLLYNNFLIQWICQKIPKVFIFSSSMFSSCFPLMLSNGVLPLRYQLTKFNT